jgi:hypothetical protein
VHTNQLEEFHGLSFNLVKFGQDRGLSLATLAYSMALSKPGLATSSFPNVTAVGMFLSGFSIL